MEKLVIEGPTKLEGRTAASGSKNAALPIMAACLLAEGPSRLLGVPRLNDVETLGVILGGLGLYCSRDGDALDCKVIDEKNSTAPYDHVRKMRASICVLGPLVARRGEAQVSLPGGCVIGPRPIDLHLKGLRALGADVKIEHGYVIARAERLHGARIYLGGPHGSTVLGTATAMMAATLAEGRTVIEHAAVEPEVEDLARFLVAMGAQIEGAGSHRVVIDGVESLHGAEHRIIPDRIEVGTLMLAAAMTGGDVTLEGALVQHLDAVIDCLETAGASVEAVEAGVRVTGSGRLGPVDVTTLPYPGFPTDMQAQVMAMLSIAEGSSVITERVYPERFMHVGELKRMGAQIKQDGPTAVVTGVGELSAAPVMASDLRASAALVLAGLVCKGESEVLRVYHLDRGYERLDEKLCALGARIERKSD